MNLYKGMRRAGPVCTPQNWIKLAYTEECQKAYIMYCKKKQPWGGKWGGILRKAQQAHHFVDNQFISVLIKPRTVLKKRL